MTDFEPDEEDLPPVAHVTMVYNGPVAPHWEMKARYGEQRTVDDFWTRVNARLLLLPKHDPQFRRNRERVNRDAERERITCDWDLGEDDPETSRTEPRPHPGAEAPAEAIATADATADEDQAGVDASTEASQEAPVEEIPVEEAPTQEVAAEEVSVEEASAEATSPQPTADVEQDSQS